MRQIKTKKLLVICGPTATGKTTLGLSLAKALTFNKERGRPLGELVSADSRQVYKGMDIGTGKDISRGADFRKVRFLSGYYLINGVRIWGYDLVSPKKDFSVAQYYRIIKKVINNIWKRGGLPILVGGTGLYIKAVVDGIPTAFVPKNKRLRMHLADKSVSELFEILAKLDAVKVASLNLSDRYNPRRLVRAIEIAQWKLGWKRKRNLVNGLIDKDGEVLFIGLRMPKDDLANNISRRVMKRLKAGMKREVESLLEEGISWENQSMNTLGYKEWREYINGDEKKSDVLKKWKRDELRYAKRQLTWFKKDKRIKWFDISKPKSKENIEKLVKKWYKTK